MKCTIILVYCLASVALARPDLYKENEDFQYSRSSPDEGQKSGFYAAQRGNMGGNYEKAKNMDIQANRQMSDLVRQVGSQLGVDPALLHGDGSRLNTHGKLYGSATASGTTYGQSSIADQRTGSFQTLAHNTDVNSLHHDTYGRASLAPQAQRSTYERYGSDNNYGGNSDRRYNALEAREENIRMGSQYDSAHRDFSGSYKSSVDSQRALDSSYHMGTDLQNIQQESIAKPSIVYSGLPVRIAVRPGQVNQINIPVTAQDRESYHGNQFVHSSITDKAEYVANNRHFDSSNVQKIDNAYSGHATDAYTDNAYSDYNGKDKNVQRGTSDNAQNYETQYSYRKEWEKHSATPVPVRPVIAQPVVLPPSISTVPVRPHTTMYVNNRGEDKADNSYAQSQSDYYARQNEQKSRYHSSADSSFKSDAAASQVSNFGSVRALDSGRDTDTYYAGKEVSDNSDVATSAPKSYKSAYSYHKSWERQGTPYVIEPAGSNVNIGIDENKHLQSASLLNNYNGQRASSSYSAQNAESQRSSAEARRSANFNQNMNNMHSNLNRQLTDSVDNMCNSNCGTRSSSQSHKATYTYNAERSYGAGEADEHGHYRYVRSTKDRPKRYSYHDRRGDIEADSGQVQDVGQELEDVGQLVELDTPTLGQELVDSDYKKLLQQNKQSAASQPSTYSHSYKNSDISGSIQPSLAPGHTNEFHYGGFGRMDSKEGNKQKEVSHDSSYSHSYSSSTGTEGRGLEKHNDRVLTLAEIMRGDSQIYNTDSSKSERPSYGYNEHNHYPSQVMHTSHSSPPPFHNHHRGFQGHDSSYPNFHNHHSSYPTSQNYHSQHHCSQHSENHQETGTDFDKEFDEIIKQLEETAKSITTDKSSAFLSTQNTQQTTSVSSHNHHSSLGPDDTSHVGYPTRTHSTVASINSNPAPYDNNQSKAKNAESSNVHEIIVQQTFSKPKTPQVVSEKHDVYYSQRDKTPSEIESLSLVSSDINSEATNKEKTVKIDDISLTLQPPHRSAHNYLNSNKQNGAGVHDINYNRNGITGSQTDRQNGASVLNENSHVDIQTENERKTGTIPGLDLGGRLDFINKDQPTDAFETPYGLNQNTVNSHTYSTYGKSTEDSEITGSEYMSAPHTTEKYSQASYSTKNIESLSHILNTKEKNIYDMGQTQLSVSDASYGLHNEFNNENSNTHETNLGKAKGNVNHNYVSEKRIESHPDSTASHQDKKIAGLEETLYVSSTNNEEQNKEITLNVAAPVETLQMQTETSFNTTGSNLFGQSTSNHHISQNNNKAESFLTGYQSTNEERMDETLHVSSSNYESQNRLNSELNKTNDNDQQIQNVNYPWYNAHTYPSGDSDVQNTEELGQTTLDMGNLNYGYQNKDLEHQKSNKENKNEATQTKQNKHFTETLTENQDSDDDVQQVEDLGQQSLNFDQQEDWGQQSENLDQVIEWGQTQDLGQQVEDIVQQVEDLGQQVEEVGQVEVSAQYGDSRTIQTNYRSHSREDIDKNQKPSEEDHRVQKEVSVNFDSTTEPGFWKRTKDKASSWFG